ncbi:MAG: lysyl-tRNA synthetase class 2, partial [Candidatus Omnitrophota bacterium]
MMSEDNELLKDRRVKYDALKASGINPYGGRVDGLMPIKDVLAGFEEGKQIKIAGRIMAWRSMGKVIFADLVDQEAKIQLFIKPALLPEGTDAIIKLLDIGDILAIEGELFVTKTEMQSVKVSALSIQSKALRPLPEKWHGLKKVETRYRQRYLDLASNMEIRKLFQTRSKVVSHIRRHLDEQRYLEVETPMMHSIPGGAAGKPFKTHHNALDIDLYMRIAPELYLKRLLVGGLERVYEINKSFRNEGISTRHNPEFTMLEVYTAYSDVEGVMDLCQSIIQTAAKEVLGTMVVQNGDIEIDLSHFDRVSFADLMQEEFDIRPEDELEVWAQKV